MKISSLSLFLSLSLFILVESSKSQPVSPYLSPHIFPQNYQKMLQSFKIFIYNSTTSETLNFASETERFFCDSLLLSQFVTQNPNEAHLFFLPFSSRLSTNTRSLSKLIRDIRTYEPYWNRTLGADHFYLSCEGIGYESDRNALELKKNSVQISCFDTHLGKFTPHKDITLPPSNRFSEMHSFLSIQRNSSSSGFLGYFGFTRGGRIECKLLDELRSDSDFVIESEPSDMLTFTKRILNSKFCLFAYNHENGLGFGDALTSGCVPVVIFDRPILNLPLMDVISWSEIAVFVDSSKSAKELKTELGGVLSDQARYERMRRLGVEASSHFIWNEQPKEEPVSNNDAFGSVMYQLWLRRHTIRYARRGPSSRQKT